MRAPPSIQYSIEHVAAKIWSAYLAQTQSQCPILTTDRGREKVQYCTWHVWAGHRLAQAVDSQKKPVSKKACNQIYWVRYIVQLHVYYIPLELNWIFPVVSRLRSMKRIFSITITIGSNRHFNFPYYQYQYHISLSRKRTIWCCWSIPMSVSFITTNSSLLGVFFRAAVLSFDLNMPKLGVNR